MGGRVPVGPGLLVACRPAGPRKNLRKNTSLAASPHASHQFDGFPIRLDGWAFCAASYRAPPTSADYLQPTYLTYSHVVLPGAT